MHEDEITLRLASIGDAALLHAWDRQPHVIAATGADSGAWDWERELPRAVAWRELLVAEHAGRAVGMVQIIDPKEEETHYWGAASPNQRAIDIWIGEPADLGRGYGTAIMRRAIARCFADPAVEAILVDPLVANRRAHRFYERLGFRCIERRTFGEDDCFVYRLARRDWRGA
jgi:aminoglycoside 6'-N-acetyltransferase